MSSSNPPSSQADSEEEKPISEIEKHLHAVAFSPDEKERNLHLATLRDFLISKPELLDARFDSQTKRNETPLLYLCRYCAFQGMELLLDLGANPNVKNEHGQTALDLILGIRQFNKVNTLPIVDAFLRHGADITPEQIKMADEIDFNNIRFYLSKYAEERPFRIAVKDNNMDAIKGCLANGFPCDIMPGGKNLIAFAREVKRPEIEKFFSEIAELFNFAYGPTPEDKQQFEVLFKKYYPDILIYVTRDKQKTLLDIAREAEVGDIQTKKDLIELIENSDKAKAYKMELTEIKENEEEKNSKIGFFFKIAEETESPFDHATRGQGIKRKREDSKDHNPQSPKKGSSHS